MTDLFAFIFIALFLLGGVAAVWQGISHIRTSRRFANSQVGTARGRIDEVVGWRARHVQAYTVVYSFKISLGDKDRWYMGRGGSLISPAIGAPIDVEYLLEDPETNRVKGWRQTIDGVFNIAVGLVYFGVIVAVMTRLSEIGG